MLDQEQDIEEDGEETETELGWIPEDGTPVVVVVPNEKHLKDGERTSGKIQEYIAYTPTNCTLTSIVHEGLRYIFD